jgi:hypothetical protein
MSFTSGKEGDTEAGAESFVDEKVEKKMGGRKHSSSCVDQCDMSSNYVENVLEAEDAFRTHFEISMTNGNVVLKAKQDSFNNSTSAVQKPFFSGLTSNSARYHPRTTFSAFLNRRSLFRFSPDHPCKHVDMHMHMLYFFYVFYV